MARQITLDGVVHRSYAELLGWVRREIEHFPQEEQAAISACADELRRVLRRYQHVEDMVLLVLHYEYMVRMEQYGQGSCPDSAPVLS